MQKSIFSKYFGLCASIVLGSILILGLVFLVFVSQYIKNDKYRQLYSNVSRGSSAVSGWYTENGGTLDRDRLDFFFIPMAESTDTTFFLTDIEGKPIFCTEKAPCIHTRATIPASVLQSIVKGGKYAEIGQLEGLYKEKFYTVGVPITTVDNVRIGYVFSSSVASLQQDNFINQMLKMFLISAVAVLVITFIAVYFVSMQLAKPLRQMSLAAVQFGKGDFSSRLPVTSYDEMGQLALALNNMAQSLSVSEASRRSFIANISHELKTPMTSIGGFIDGILDGTIPPEKQRHYLGIASSETQRMSRLVRTMLNLSKIEAGEMKINTAKIDMVDTVCRTVFSFERQIEAKNLTIEGLDHGKVLVEADPDLIHQVVYNLTENAVKFVNEGGYLKFEFREEPQYTSISIKNSGAGLSKEEIPKIFDRFYKTDKSRGLDKNGVGLGLYIVRTVINLHNGEIMVRSVEGEYSEFIFTLPNHKPSKFKKNS